MNRTEIKELLKKELINRLDLFMETDEIDDNAPLFGYDEEGNGLGLDSIDVLEMIVAVRQNFGIEINAEENRQIFNTIETMAEFVEEKQSASK